MLQNRLQDVVRKVAELLARRILCAYRIKGGQSTLKSKKIRVSFLLGKSVLDLYKISFLK